MVIEIQYNIAVQLEDEYPELGTFYQYVWVKINSRMGPIVFIRKNNKWARC